MAKRYEPKTVEQAVMEKWKKLDIMKKIQTHNSEGPLFSFLEGPPTVNGYMHIGHTRGRVYKDIVLRYKTMKGFNVWRRAGWDCQGLPTEIEVEKRLGITSKRDIEKIGLEKFVEEANKVVDHYLFHWRRASERLGLWLDYDNAYETRREEYMEHIWYLLAKAYESGDLVESHRVVPTCPHCETALSQHEMAQGYEEVSDPSIYVKIPLEEGGYVVIWTTTPWTLPGNEAVAVAAEARYAEIEVGGESWFVAEKLLEKFCSETGLDNVRVKRFVEGSALAGKRYLHPLAEEVSIHKNHVHKLIPSEHVSLEEGSGFVHIAPAHGPEDFSLGLRHGLPIFCPVSTSGKFTEEGGVYNGLSVEAASERVIKDLERKKLLVKSGEIVHSYPHCWRCGTKLVYLASVQWYLKVDKIKEKMIEGNKKVKWWPEWAGTNRFGDWLINAQDWCISRSKIWGTPLNVWRCESCGFKKVVESRKQLEEAVEKPAVRRMHRPWVDMYVFRCGQCGGMMKRIPFVLDTWLDSGVAFFASVNALSSPQLFEKLYPYDFVTEAMDQTRGWFYTLLFTSTMLRGVPPYKSVLNQGHVLDEFGKKMSKSRGNVVWAEDAFELYGADPLRLYLSSKAEVWDTINFVPSEVNRIAEDLNILWNIFIFASTYAKIDNFNPRTHLLENYLDVLRPEDRWILARVNDVVSKVSSSLEEMEIHRAIRGVLEFITEDLSRTYLRSVRRLAWTEAQTREKMAAYACLHYVLKKTLLMLAVFAPFVSEALYDLVRDEDSRASIHLEKWPEPDTRFMNERLVEDMAVARNVLTAILAARQRGGRKLRSPVHKITVVPRNLKAYEAIKTYWSFVKESANTEQLELLEPGQVFKDIRLVAEVDLSQAGPRVGRRLPLLLEYLKKADGFQLKDQLEREGGLKITLMDEQYFLPSSYFSFKKILPEKFSTAENEHAEIYVDLTVSEELEAMSAAKEVIRRVQVMRKEANLDVLSKIECVVQSDDDDFLNHLRRMKPFIEEETRSTMEFTSLKTPMPSEYFSREWDVDGVFVKIGFSRR
ncbi:MAG: isoleucine--tRNA ligase [Candidatus Caldarchaeum sp.]|nr:isoleucine--tRNA ligase [Candidatus Caldarchaeum sp.]